MTWLFPLYLAGAAAIVLPILLHLRRRPPKERVVFSSLMFLERSPQLLTKRSKLEQLLLLALRCLALILLALMFARPFFRGGNDSAPGGKGEAVVLLLDTSASMHRGDLWTQAGKLIESRASKATPADRVSLVRFDRETKTLWSFDQDTKAAGNRVSQFEGALKSVQPSWAATDLGRALADAAGSFQRSGSSTQTPSSKRIVLVSDLQDGARLDALRGFAWPDDVEVEVAQVSLPTTNNMSISLAATESDDETAKIETSAAARAAPGVRVRVSNVRESTTESFSMQWDKGTAEPVTGYLPAGASRVLRTSPVPGNANGDSLVLSGDAWDFDNRIYLAPPQPREARVVYLDASAANAGVLVGVPALAGSQSPGNGRREGLPTVEEPPKDGTPTKTPAGASSPLFYLMRALQPTASLKPMLEVTTRLKGADIAFVQGGALDTVTLAATKQWIEQGGFGVFTLPRDASEKEIGALVDAKSLTVTESTGAEYSMLGDVDVTHPLLHPFADARLRDFTKIRFWHHRQVKWKEDDANKPQVLAKFDNDDPAMLLWPRGKGKLLVLTAGWHPADSQLALSTKFVPLLFGWLEAAGFSHEAMQSLIVGDVLPIGDGSAVIEKPDGTKINHTTGTVSADAPGFFKITQGGATKIIAVNLAPEEGRIHPMEPQKLAEAGVKLSGALGAHGAVISATEKQRLDSSEEEARQRMWLWVLVSLLVVLAWETWLAGRKRQNQTVPA